jgi:hypothetical protein
VGGFPGLTKGQCQDKCDKRADCKAYVYRAKGCETHDADACFLKTTVGGQSLDPCACFATKPFVAPPPLCATTAIPSAGEDRTILAAGASCPTLSKQQCCKHSDGSPEYFGQVCVPPVAATYWDGSTCQPLAVAQVP